MRIALAVWVAVVALAVSGRAVDWQQGSGFRRAALSVPQNGKPGFTRLPSSATGILFTNFISVGHYKTNQILLNGCGVAAGDVDGDGLCDIYLCRLEGDNALYRNLGNWRFENITAAAGVACPGMDASGALLADLDGDRDLDLVVNFVGHGTHVFYNDGKARFKPHHTILNPKKSPDTCFQCHLDKRAEFSLPHHHPVIEGKMSCSDCHNPHKGDAMHGGPFSHTSESDACAKCHTAQRGPFVFEHEAVREGCTTCHAVHGSVNQKMLVQRNHTLCLKCHFQQQTGAGVIVIGGRDHTSFLRRGTCWSAGCHEAVHGSQIGSSLRF